MGGSYCEQTCVGRISRARMIIAFFMISLSLSSALLDIKVSVRLARYKLQGGYVLCVENSEVGQNTLSLDFLWVVFCIIHWQ